MSDSSDDEDQRFREAIDPTLFTNDMYKESTTKTEKVVENRKSNRHVKTENHSRDFQVSSDMQTRVGKKISDIINSKIVFVDVVDSSDPQSDSRNEDVVRLFSDSLYAISEKCSQEITNKIKKRRLKDEFEQNHVSEDHSDDKIQKKKKKSKKHKKDKDLISNGDL